MSDEELFQNLTTEERIYAHEALARWNPEVVKESYRRYNKLTAAQKQAMKEGGVAFNKEWAALIGTDPASSAAQDMVAKWRKGIEFFWTPNLEGLLGLAQMYNNDPRFKSTYNKVDPRLAAYILECVQVYVKVQKK